MRNGGEEATAQISRKTRTAKSILPILKRWRPWPGSTPCPKGCGPTGVTPHRRRRRHSACRQHAWRRRVTWYAPADHVVGWHKRHLGGT